MPPELAVKLPDADLKTAGIINREQERSNGGKIVILSYRLPLVKNSVTGQYELTVGGMSNAVRQALNSGPRGQKIDADWYGNLTEGEPYEPQGVEEAINPSLSSKGGNGYRLRPVDIPMDEFNDFYIKVANMGIWPNFHGFDYKVVRDARVIDEGWNNFVKANQRFAQEYLKNSGPGDKVFVQDYQLPLVAQELKNAGYRGRVSYFLHIPVPSPESFFKLPHANEILQGLLKYDRLGFQTEKDLANFKAIVASVQDQPQKLPLLEATPIGIDPLEFINIATQENVLEEAEKIRRQYPDMQIVFTGGRLEYAKAFVKSILAFEKMLVENPDMVGKVVFRIATPVSRAKIKDYQEYGVYLQKAADLTNKKWGREGWQPIVLMGKLEQEGMAANFLAADVILAGSRADGMNLTPKEAIAVASTKNEEETPVIIISTGTGAHYELTGSLTFDPLRLQEQAKTMAQAFRMPMPERIARRLVNQDAMFDNTIDNWAGRGNLYFRPNTKEVKGQKRIIVGWSDLDGTANNEKVAEGERMGTIGPAREAFSRLEVMRIPVGLISARGVGEVEIYQDALDVTGPIIAEDGQVLVFPKGIRLEQDELPQELRHFTLHDHHGRQALLLSNIDVPALKVFMSDVISEALRKNIIESRDEIYSSLTKEPSELRKSTGHQSDEFAAAAADRLGSGFIDKIKNLKNGEAFLNLLKSMAPAKGVRVVGGLESASIYGLDSNKGNALRIFDRLAKYFFPDLIGAEGTAPIGFGNGPNDITMLRAVKEMGGLPFLVGNDIPDEEIPKDLREVIRRTTLPDGQGILESLHQVEDWLAKSASDKLVA